MMRWNPTKAHWLDLFVLEHWHARYPTANIRVVNRWGYTVCGVVVPEPTESFDVVEPALG